MLSVGEHGVDPLQIVEGGFPVSTGHASLVGRNRMGLGDNWA
jgi:hypothetical protein